jgi:hypothetical protein
VRMAISFNENFTVRNLERLRLRGLACAQACRPKKGQIMKYALISSLSLLAIIVGTEAANAQAEINPNIYPPYRGAPAAQQPWEWYSTPGPVRRGSQCVADVDAGRGYGFMKDCPAPKASAAPRPSRVAHRSHRKSVHQ